MRKLLSTLLAALLLVTLAPAATLAQATDMGVPLNPEVSGNVELWHFWGSPVRRTAIRRVVAICEQALPNITIDEVFKPYGDIWTANIAAVAAGSGMPDVIVSDRPQLPKDAAQGIYESLQSRIDADGFPTGDFYPFTWEQTQYQGESYGIPFETDVRVNFYAKTLLEQAGLDPENPPATWDELWDAADKLDVKDESGNLERIAFLPTFGNVGWDLWVRTLGYEVVQDGRPVVDAPEVAQTLTWMKQWIDRYGGWQNVQNFLAQYGAPPNDPFMVGAVVMKVDVAGYNSILTFYRPQIEVDGNRVNMEWGTALPPYADTPASTSGGFAMSIPAGAENADAAWEFVKCAGSIPAQVSWARDTYAIPSLIPAAEEPVLMADPQWQFFVDAMEVSSGGTYVPEYPNWGQEVNNRLEQIWTGELSVEEALSQAQEAIDRTIEENR